MGDHLQRPAWAVTIHKAQGQTYGRAHIDLAGGGAFAPGQLYVALSRCRSLEGLTLERRVTAGDVRVNGRAVAFIRSAFANGERFRRRSVSRDLDRETRVDDP